MNKLEKIKENNLNGLKLFYINKPSFNKMSYLELKDRVGGDSIDFKDVLNKKSKKLKKYASEVTIEYPKLYKEKIAKDFNYMDTDEVHYVFQYLMPVKYYKQSDLLDDTYNDDDLLVTAIEFYFDDDTGLGHPFAVDSSYYEFAEEKVYAFEGKYIEDQKIYLDYSKTIINKIKKHNYDAGYYMIDDNAHICLYYDGGKF